MFANDRYDSRIKCRIPGCNREFSRKHDMERHVAGNHHLSVPYKCNICLRPHARKDKLREHIQRAHPGATTSSLGHTDSMFELRLAHSLSIFTQSSALADAGSIVPGFETGEHSTRDGMDSLAASPAITRVTEDTLWDNYTQIPDIYVGIGSRFDQEYPFGL